MKLIILMKMYKNIELALEWLWPIFTWLLDAWMI